MPLKLEELDTRLEALARELEGEGINTIDYIVGRMGWEYHNFHLAVASHTADMIAASVLGGLTHEEAFRACYMNGILHGIVALLDESEVTS